MIKSKLAVTQDIYGTMKRLIHVYYFFYSGRGTVWLRMRKMSATRAPYPGIHQDRGQWVIIRGLWVLFTGGQERLYISHRERDGNCVGAVVVYRTRCSVSGLQKVTRYCGLRTCLRSSPVGRIVSDYSSQWAQSAHEGFWVKKTFPGMRFLLCCTKGV